MASRHRCRRSEMCEKLTTVRQNKCLTVFHLRSDNGERTPPVDYDVLTVVNLQDNNKLLILAKSERQSFLGNLGTEAVDSNRPSWYEKSFPALHPSLALPHNHVTANDLLYLNIWTSVKTAGTMFHVRRHLETSGEWRCWGTQEGFYLTGA